MARCLLAGKAVAGIVSAVDREHPEVVTTNRARRQRREMRTLAASPDYAVGSVHAPTEDGSLLIASASGSQLGPLVSGAGQVILVIGAQKIVRDVATGMRRIYEYCYPHRGCPGPRACGVPSGVNNILIINKVVTPGRVTAIIVNDRLGF
jgi:LUD domain